MNKPKAAKQILINHTDLTESFDLYLNDNSNKRLFLSGKYGTGKTTFLKHFFHNKDGYEVFHLFPVNYHISSNEDISSVLSYDILIELINRYGEDKIFSEAEIKEGLIIQLQASLSPIIIPALSILIDSFSTLGSTFISETTTDLRMWIAAFLLIISQKTSKALTSNPSFFSKKMPESKKKVRDEMAEINIKIPSSANFLDTFICKKIKTLKEERESVLILDDLDRVDPDHIFRLLNVFSACLDNDQNGDNKFGFDKVVLVADEQNIRNIFHNRYGEKVDFEGYFDKFYSNCIFLFDTEKEISKELEEIVNSLKFDANNKRLSDLMSRRGYLRLFLIDILNQSIFLEGKNKIELRQLLKGSQVQLLPLMNPFIPNNEFNCFRNTTLLSYINLGIKTLISIIGGSKNDLEARLTEIISEQSPLFIHSYPPAVQVHSTFNAALLPAICAMSDIKSERNVSSESDLLIYEWKKYRIIMAKNQSEFHITNIGGTDSFEHKANENTLFYELILEYLKKNGDQRSTDEWEEVFREQSERA